MTSRIGGNRPKVSIPKKTAKKGSEPLPHFGGKAKASNPKKAGKVGASRGDQPASAVSANRGGMGTTTPVSTNRGGTVSTPVNDPVSGGRFGGVPTTPTETPSVSRGGYMPGTVSGGRGGMVDTFNPAGPVSGGRF